MNRRILLSAGDPSGDRHAAALVPALRRQWPDAMIEGHGGARLAAAGVSLVSAEGARDAMGLVEAAGQLPAHLRLFSTLRRRLRADAYDLVVVLDYPGFHLRLAAAARRIGVPVLYYIAPQLWAWGDWRAGRLRRAVDRLAVILPFEERFFAQRGIRTSFVGHPLAECPVPPSRSAARAKLGLAADAPALALLPGSRRDEIARHWVPFRDAAIALKRRVPDLAVVVAAADGATYPGADGFVLRHDDAATVCAAADAGLCKSGTATLEAARARMPMVIAYRMHPWTFALARRLVRVPWIGLVNLVAGRLVAPELLQEAATAERLAEAVLPLLERDGAPARAQRDAFPELCARLGPPGAADRVAALAAELVA